MIKILQSRVVLNEPTEPIKSWDSDSNKGRCSLQLAYRVHRRPGGPTITRHHCPLPKLCRSLSPKVPRNNGNQSGNGTRGFHGFDLDAPIFLPDEVKYQHNGSPLLEEDHVMLGCTGFSEQETTVESFVLEVKVSELTNSIAVVQNYLEVPEFYEISSKPLDKNILTFKLRPGTSCVVRTLVSDLNLPGFGQVVIEEQTRDSRLVSGGGREPANREERVRCSGNKALPS
ncbi:unnamed protein product [Ranitomeya imitator]|uniref:FRAS1-related extracellular matrix protein N-terminal domain-containing protein n=1 Tax=Ranitomeya imitator TaxID=111125 RepID=A0ABN9LHQ5_9NEOB|nr:unnamed protein product [Ranitomeya imitator]